jgi:hypothetical protein
MYVTKKAMTPASRLLGSLSMRSSAYATQFSKVAAVTSVQAARPKSPQSSGDFSAKKLTPRMEKTAMAMTATNMAESTGSTACVKACTIFRRDLNCETTRSARKTRTMRIDFTLAPVKANVSPTSNFVSAGLDIPAFKIRQVGCNLSYLRSPLILWMLIPHRSRTDSNNPKRKPRTWQVQDKICITLPFCSSAYQPASHSMHPGLQCVKASLFALPVRKHVPYQLEGKEDGERKLQPEE